MHRRARNYATSVSGTILGQSRVWSGTMQHRFRAHFGMSVGQNYVRLVLRPILV